METKDQGCFHGEGEDGLMTKKRWWWSRGGRGGGCRWLTSSSKLQKVCVAKREEAVETAQAHLGERGANSV